MISSLVQGYGSEDESDAEEGKGEKKNTKQEDNDKTYNLYKNIYHH